MKRVSGYIVFVVLIRAVISSAAGNCMPGETIVPLKAPFPMPDLKRPNIPDRSVDIRDFGARPGKAYDNTEAIRKAIGDCAGQGGGAVIIPKGDWYTGPVHLKSNINLHFEKGAELYFIPDASLYLPAVRVLIYGIECYNFSPMIYAYGCHDIAVTGKGRIYGPGLDEEAAKTHHRSWSPWRESQHKLGLANGVPIRKSGMGKLTWKAGVHILQDAAFRTNVIKDRDVSGTYRLDPSLIQPVACSNVLMEGFMIARGGPMWTITPSLCTNVIIRNIAIHTIGTAGDAIDIVSCENVLVERCDIQAGDDIIALKSGFNQDGWRMNKPVKNVVIRYINGFYSHSGISIGSELSGGIENIYCHDNRVNVSKPFRIKSRPGRGATVRNVTCERFIVGKPIKVHYTDWVLPEMQAFKSAQMLVELNNNYGVRAKRVMHNRGTKLINITIRDFEATSAGSGIQVVSYMTNLFRNIVFENISLGKGRPGNIRNADVTVTNYTIGGKPAKCVKR